MLQDEGRFGRISTPQRCWAPRGIRPCVPNQIVREYTYAYVAVSPHDGTLDSLIMPQVSEQAMSIFLREVSRRHQDEFILMVMDGAGWHKAKALSVPAEHGADLPSAVQPRTQPGGARLGSHPRKWFPQQGFQQYRGCRGSIDRVPERSRKGPCISGKNDRFSVDRQYELARKIV